MNHLESGTAFQEPSFPSDSITERTEYKLSDNSDNSSTAFLRNTETNDSKEEIKPTFWQRTKTAFKYARPLLTTILIDALIPLAIYYLLKNYTSILVALIISGVPPLLHVIYGFIKHRKLDILGCIFVFSFIFSAIISIISGNVRQTLLRDSTTTAILSLGFFFTLIPIRTKWFYNRPLIFLISQQMLQASPPVQWTDSDGNSHSVVRSEWSWDHVSVYRKFCYILNAVWAVILMGEFIAKVIMIECTTLTIDQIVLYGNIILIVVTVTVTLGTTIVSHRVRKSTVAFTETWLKNNDFSERLPKILLYNIKAAAMISCIINGYMFTLSFTDLCVMRLEICKPQLQWSNP